ncbi:hypothetical protein SADUNF_Sadunf02G0025800 [Salix dunnii]|uniref:TLC domain-containing protein n=1 Tax=Salix dunnii TaxID=1413687 RepID=A0A835N5Y8_9ROSI|nr:hypothetical protein SADUNF_Sadunf02G0025800 [Salix dunnii]
MEDHILRTTILGIISWTTAFHLFRKLLPKRSFEFCNRLVSTVHATLAVALASLSVENWACPVSPLASKSSPSQMQALAVSLSYLIYDLICCQFDKRVSIDNTIHHLVSIVGMAAGLVYRKSASELIAALCMTEISSPFLHLRELLKELGYRDTDLNLAADISFAAIFSFARMVFGPYITWVTVTADNPLIIKAMALGLQLVSAYWFYKIARMKTKSEICLASRIFDQIVFTNGRKLFPKRSFEFCNRLVSTVHATLAVALASLSVENWACPVSPLASKSSPSQMQALAVSLSYLIYDLICCQFDKRVSIDNTIHHLVSIVGMAAGLIYRKCGSEMMAALFITEISSPFLHLREFLKELGYRDTDLNLAADISFAAIFSFARMVFGPYIAWLTLTADNPLIIKAMALGLQLVSAYWFYKIARMVSYKLTKRAASKNLVCARKLS